MRVCATALALALALPAAALTRQHLGPPAPAQVRRIVTLAPSLSEIVLAVGAGDRLVGVTRFDDDPRVARLPRVGGYNDPEPETVLGLHPDLILAQTAPENRGPVETLARLGIPVEAFALEDLKQIEDAIEQIGALLGLAERGQALRATLERHRAVVREKAARGPHPRALLVFGLDPLVVAGPAGFAGELLRDVGAVNAFGDSARPFPRMSVEAAVRARPDVIVVCGFDPPVGRPVIPGLPRARVETLRSTALLHPGPRLVEGLDDLFAAVHGKRSP
jgi:iron complex transport system substrate-binding protein